MRCWIYCANEENNGGHSCGFEVRYIELIPRVLLMYRLIDNIILVYYKTLVEELPKSYSALNPLCTTRAQSSFVLVAYCLTGPIVHWSTGLGACVAQVSRQSRKDT